MAFFSWLRCLSLALSCAAADAAAAAPTLLEGASLLLQAGTGLRWMASDSRQELNWAGTKSWCDKRGAGWRLPTIDERAA